MIHALPPGYNSGDTIYCYFPAYDSNGASVTITGLAVTDIEIYKDGSVTQRASDNGYTLLDTDGIDFDSTTGAHGFSVDTSDNSDAGFYADGSHYLIMVNAVTIDSQTVVFMYECRLGVLLRPTTDGRKLDVTTTGGAGIDWGNVENQGTSVDLSATATNLVDTCTTNTDMRGTDSAALASNVPDSLSHANLIAQLITAYGLDHLLQTSVAGTDVADNSIIAQLVSSSATADWDDFVNTTDSLQAGRDNIGTAGAGLTAINLPNQTMDITGNITGNLSGSVGSVTGAVGSVTGAVGSVTGNVGGNVTGSIGSLATQAKADVNAEVDTAFTTQMADSVATDGTIATREQAMLMILRFLHERSVSGTTVTVTKEDGSTASMTFTLDDATTPTSITRTT